jgi:uncharacterized protein YbjT (DUF2867 family)
MKNLATASKILVVGATGFLGMEICRQLTMANKNVTGLVRNTSSQERANALKQWGVKLIEGDLKDRSSIKKALQGITTVISTASSTMSKQDGDSIQTVDNDGQANLVDEAVAAGGSQYIYISIPSMGGDFPLEDAKRRVEKKIIASNLTYTILQPTFFMEAWLSPAIGFDFPNAKATIYGEGKNKISWISIQDVAAFAVASVDNAVAKNKTIELGGPDSLSPLEVISIFESASGKKFELQHVPEAALQGQKNAAPDDLSKTFASLMLNYAAGNEISMQHTLKAFQVKLNSVQDYAKRVMQVSDPVY